MSLADRLAIVIPVRSNSGGCTTCQWLESLSDGDRAAFLAWIADGKSMTQLWEIASGDPDNPLTVGLSAMRLHVRTCQR
jgi:hypothetical protein